MCYFVKYNEISIAKINQISCILFQISCRLHNRIYKLVKGHPHSHPFDREIKKKTTNGKLILIIYPYFLCTLTHKNMMTGRLHHI